MGEDDCGCANGDDIEGRVYHDEEAAFALSCAGGVVGYASDALDIVEKKFRRVVVDRGRCRGRVSRRA